MLKDYLSEFDSLHNDTQRRIANYELIADGDKLLEQSSIISRQIRDLKSCLKSIDTSLGDIPASERSTILIEYRQHERNFQALQRSWVVASTRNKAALPTADHRRVALATEKSDRSTRQLKEATTMLEESDVIGSDVMTDLHKQREVILRTKQNVSKADANLDTANSSLSRMSTWWNSLW
eukprot:Lankesteria_metandrocarpae@DN3185_c0_g1_i1.p1